VTFSREEKLLQIQRVAQAADAWSEERRICLSFPEDIERARNVDSWLDLLEAWTVPSRKASPAAPPCGAVERARAIRRFHASIQVQEIKVLGHIWAEADIQMALAWLALRDAAAQTAAVRMTDGTVLLPLGAGIVAVVAIHASPGFFSDGSGQDIRAAVDLRISKAHHAYGAPELSVTGTLDSGTAYLRHQLPHQLTIIGAGIHAAIRFVGSPLHRKSGAGASLALDTALLATHASEQEQAESEAADWRVRESDDDDD
jgi:hypothetical protein